MSELFANLRQAVSENIIVSIKWMDVLDIVIIAFIIYQLLRLVKNTRALQVMKGLGIILAASVVSSWLGLPIMKWLLGSLLSSGVVLAVVLFQPELRRAFERLGRGRFFELSVGVEPENAKSIDEIVRAIQNLSKRKVGVLMVFTRKSDLKDIIGTGTVLDSSISSMLIENIFEPNTPLHDGAMVITGNRIVAAGCFLPLSENAGMDKKLGTRHRAALGVSEQSDAVVLVVSEETGVISSATGGTLRRYLDISALRSILTELYDVGEKPVPIFNTILSRKKRTAKEDIGNEKEQ